MLVVRPNIRLRNVTMVQVYGPTTKAEEVTEMFYEGLERESKKIFKSDITMIIGDFKTEVWKPSIIGTVVSFLGLDEANSAGKRFFAEFCEDRELVLVST